MLDMGVIDMIIRPTSNMLYVMDLMDTKVTSRKSQARPTRGEGDERGTSKYNGFRNAGWVIWEKRKDKRGLVENLVNLAHTCKKRVIPVIHHRKFFWIFRKILG